MNKNESQLPNQNSSDVSKNSLNKEKDKINATTKNDMNNEFVEENYLKINTQNQFDIYDLKESDRKLNEIINYIEELIEVESNKEMLWKFLDHLFPNCKRDAFLISKYISKKLIKSKKINRKIIEEKIEYFYSKRIELRYSQKYILTKENINNIGYILCFSYSKFEDKNINKKELNKYIKYNEKSNILNDFYNYCNMIGKMPQDINKLDYLEKRKDKYFLPGEFLFLIECFNNINVLEIDMNEIKDSKQQHNIDFYLYVITLLNIHYLITLSDYTKINFYNEKIQKDIYDYFTGELNLVYKLHNRDIKKNKVISKNEIFRKRWNFEKEYIITKCKFLPNEEVNIFNVEQNNNKNIKLEDNLNDYDKDSDFEESQYFENKDRNGLSYIQQNKTFIKSKISDLIDFGLSYPLNNSSNRNLTFVESLDKIIMDKYDELISKNKFILELLCIIVLSFLRLKIKNLELIINDCYYKEFVYSFALITSSSSNSSKNNFHIFDFFIEKMKELQSFNIEFNSLDYLTFNKLLSVIKNNKEIKSLQISFFSSLISYSPQYLYKLYQQNFEKKGIEKRISSPESFFLNEFLPYFVENFEVLFQLIKLKMINFEVLSFIFDIPEIISVKKRYLIVILKFILNIFFLVNNPMSKIRKLKIISPKTVLDTKSLNEIEDIFDSISLNKNNNAIEELTVQLQFYRISNLKNIICHNLIKLRIGEIDILTLRELVKYLCSYNFYKISSLQYLTIGILNHIVNFTKEIKYLFNELFSIKIKTLKELNVYSNVYIDDKKSFYNIFFGNWIPNCTLTLNEKSELSWKKKEMNKKLEKIIDKQNKKTSQSNNEIKIMYLLHHELEDEFLTLNEKNLRKKINLTKEDYDVAWYLRHIVMRYLNNNNNLNNYYTLKNIIFNILKYLYITKNANIKMKIVEDQNDN